MTSIESTLQQRGNRYGEFGEHARITQAIKRAYSDSPNWVSLSDDKREALEMVAHKIGRILNGDPEYADSWHDIIGYTKLVEDTLTQDVINTVSERHSPELTLSTADSLQRIAVDLSTFSVWVNDFLDDQSAGLPSEKVLGALHRRFAELVESHETAD